MIEAHEIIPRLLSACPGFETAWREHIAWWGDEHNRGFYNDAGVFAHYLVDAYISGDTECFPAAFAAVEQRIVDGTDDVQGLAIVGILEDLQSIASHQPFGHAVFTPWLGSQSCVAWDQLLDSWEGKTSLADVIHAERGNVPAMLRIDDRMHEISSLEDLHQRLAKVSDWTDISLELHGKDSITLLVNGNRAFVMFIRNDADTGFSSRDPDYDGPFDAAIDFKLSNGQYDEYPLSWTISLVTALQALDYFMIHGDRTPEICWHDDTR